MFLINRGLRSGLKIQWAVNGTVKQTRYLSSVGGQKTKEEMEEELFKLKRKSVLFFNKQNYKSALDYSIRCLDLTEQYMGKKNRVYASALSNVALMHKSLGENIPAMEKYTSSLHIYRSTGGQKSQQYSATLQNLGILYKEMASEAKKLDKEQLLERSEEALEESLNVRIELLGHSHRETLFAVVAYCGALRLTNKLLEAEKMLKRAIRDTNHSYGDHDSLLARLYNTLGLVYKQGEKYGEAKDAYEKAIAIQTNIFGDAHKDSVAMRHNLAELFMAAGDRQSARDVQDHLMEILNIEEEDIAVPAEEVKETPSDSKKADTSVTQQKGNEGDEDVIITRTKGSPPVQAHHALATVGASSGADQDAINAAIFEAVDNMTGDAKERRAEESRSAKAAKAPKRKTVNGIDGFTQVGDNLSMFDVKKMMDQKSKDAAANPDRAYGTGTADDPTDEELYGFDDGADTTPVNEKLSVATFSSRKNLIMERSKKGSSVVASKGKVEDEDE